MANKPELTADEKVKLYEKVFADILAYEAYSWNNDRQFIESHIKEVWDGK